MKALLLCTLLTYPVIAQATELGWDTGMQKALAASLLTAAAQDIARIVPFIPAQMQTGWCPGYDTLDLVEKI